MIMSRGALGVVAPALVVLVSLAGCASEGDVTEEDTGSLKLDVVDDGPDVDATTGRVHGVVLTTSGFPLAGARVTILSVDHSPLTDAQGAFVFDNVSAGQQTLRVERENYHTLQRNFDVVAGKLTRLEIVLNAEAEGDFAEHVHNHWRGEDTYVLLDKTVQHADNIMAVPPECTAVAGYCTSFDIQPALGRIVPPGTTKVVIEIEFEPGPLFEREAMYFSMYPPRDSNGDFYYVFQQVKTGSERIEFELPGPGMHDHGHARWTSWRFYLSWSGAPGMYAGQYYNALFKGPVDVTITAHKGALELDPPHERYWAESGVLDRGVSEPSSACAQLNPGYLYVDGILVYCGSRYPNPSVYSQQDGTTYCYSGCMGLRNGDTVPPGTTRVAFTVEHYWGDEAPVPQAGAAFERDDFIIGYKTAASHPFLATWDNYTWLEPIETYDTDDGIAWRFEVEVEESETDPYYQQISQWVLWPAIQGHEDASAWSDGMQCYYEACGNAYFRLLEFKAINDEWETARNEASTIG